MPAKPAKISKKQAKEVEYLSRYVGVTPYTPTTAEVYWYLRHTTGCNLPRIKSKYAKKETNRLLQNKRSLDIAIKLWREDMMGKLTNGQPIFYASEIIEKNNEYSKRLATSIAEGLDYPYNIIQIKDIQRAEKADLIKARRNK